MTGHLRSDTPEAGATGGQTAMDIKSVLVANRGEIALRVIRACHELGLGAIAVYAVGDEHSQHVTQADRAICIGPRDIRASYLNAAALVAAALGGGADAIHPGYGFLSENAAFARMVTDAGLKWIGAPAESIARMGDKAAARATMQGAGVPVVP